MPNEIYLDYHATTPVDPRVADRVYHFMVSEFGNASSTEHEYGDRAALAINTAAKQIADLVGASPREIIWTSGATESINLAILGSLVPFGSAQGTLDSKLPVKIALSPLEHKAVLDTCQHLARQGQAKLTYLQVDRQGRLDLDNLEAICDRGLDLLCVMAANNEIGNIYPIEKIGSIAKKYHIPFLCDASQAVGKMPIDCQNWGITYLAVSGHKIYAPKGIGALVVAAGKQLSPITFGGGHQQRIRAGTLNVAAIVGLGLACELRQQEMQIDEKAIANKRDRLAFLLSQAIPNLIINGDRESKLAGNLHISIPGIPNRAIIARVRERLAISTGSACSSGVESPSHVLRSIGLTDAEIAGALRIGIGKFTTDAEIDTAATILIAEIDRIRALLG